MDWKTMLAAIAFVALVLLQAKTNEHSKQSSGKVEAAEAQKTLLQRNQASLPKN